MCVVLSFMRFPLGRATVRPMSTAACRIRKRSPEKDHDKPDPRSADAKDLRKQVCPSKLGRHIELFYELKCNELASLFHGLASVIHQAWNAEPIELGTSLRERFQQDFLEVSEIEASGTAQTAAGYRTDAGH